METQRHMAGHDHQALGPRMWCYKLPPRCSRRSFQLGRCSFHCRSICHRVQSSLDRWGYETGQGLLQHRSRRHITASALGNWRQEQYIDFEELGVVGRRRQSVGRGSLTFNWEIKLWRRPSASFTDLHKNPTSPTLLSTKQWFALRISCSTRSMSVFHFYTPLCVNYQKLISCLQVERARTMHVSAVTTNLCVPNSISQRTPKPDPTKEKDLSKPRRDPTILLALLLAMAILVTFLLAIQLTFLLTFQLTTQQNTTQARKPSATRKNVHCKEIFLP